MSESWTSVRIAQHHNLDHFDCGVRVLNLWLRSLALHADSQDVSRTYVWTGDQSERVRAHYTIAPTMVRRVGLPSAAAGGNTAIPAYLLGRLALDRSLHGQGLGGALLIDALRRVDRAVAESGGRLLVVDPVDQSAAQFFAHFGFNPIRGSDRLYLRASTIRALLGPATR